MAKLAWGALVDRIYESGTDRGVLYPPSGAPAAWNGLISVTENVEGGEPQPFYLDGVKFINVAATEDFAATLNAFSAPDVFALCDGTKALAAGLFATQQPRKQFGLSYRTKLGNPNNSDLGYKTHLVYNCMASPSSRANTSVGSSVSPLALSWGITTVPKPIAGSRPTAHLIVDSTKADPTKLLLLQDALYGTAIAAPYLPTPAQVIDFLD